jgi:hypothetical protein
VLGEADVGAGHTKGGNPRDCGSLGFSFVLLYPSDAVPHGVCGIAPDVEERDKAPRCS